MLRTLANVIGKLILRKLVLEDAAQLNAEYL